MHPMLTIAVRAARNAGNIIVKGFEQHNTFDVEQKGDNDFVTKVDFAAENMIIETIQTSYPDHSFVAEESGLTEGKDTDHQWIVDPIDGTRNFINGIPHFAVSIALKIKGRTEVAVVFNPISGEMFTANRGGGAQFDGYRMRSSKANSLAGTLIATGFPFKQKQHLTAYLNIFKEVMIDCSDLRSAGSAALDISYAAAGRVDGFWGLGLKPWDFAAAELIAQESGAIVTDFAGGHNYLNSGNLVVANPKVAKALLNIIRKHGSEAIIK